MSPQTFDVKSIIRPNILKLVPYESARDKYSEGVLLDANENAWGSAVSTEHDLHRYPDPLQKEVKTLWAALRDVPSIDNFFIGVGADEAIDMLLRVVCVPGKDSILVCPPTYGVYSVDADINDIKTIEVPLVLEDGPDVFQPRVDAIRQAVIDAEKRGSPVKVIFITTPGNPTATYVPLDKLRQIAEIPEFKGLLVSDEAYIDFVGDNSGKEKSAVRLLVDEGYQNVTILQTLSKSFGLAGLRVGALIANTDLIFAMNSCKQPYNVSRFASSIASRALSPKGVQTAWDNIKKMYLERERLTQELLKLDDIGTILDKGHSNFVLAQVINRESGKPDSDRANKVFSTLANTEPEERVIVRYRGGELGCPGSLRITVGTPEENNLLLAKLRQAFTEI